MTNHKGEFIRPGKYSARITKVLVSPDGRLLKIHLHPEPQYFPVDPDAEGHYLVLLADYHSYLVEKIMNTTIGNPDMPFNEGVGETRYSLMLFELYMIGNLEGRLISSHKLTADDLHLLQDWGTELAELKSEGSFTATATEWMQDHIASYRTEFRDLDPVYVRGRRVTPDMVDFILEDFVQYTNSVEE